MLGGLEYVGDREDRIRRVELLERARGDLGDIEYAGLDQLYHRAVVAQLTVRVNVEGVIGFFFHLVTQVAQTDVDRMPVAVAVRNQQMLGILHAAAAGGRQKRRRRERTG